MEPALRKAHVTLIPQDIRGLIVREANVWAALTPDERER
jgi:hypothetical protein